MTLTNNLKEVSKKIAYWTLPLGVQQIIRTIRKGTNSLAQELLLERNQELRDRHKGERCFILATGPSIREQDLKVLKNEYCIAVSNFYLHPDLNMINPQYYCIAPWHPPHNKSNYIELLYEVGNRARESTFFLGISECQQVQENSLKLGKELYYLQFGASNSEIISSGIDLTRATLPPQSVTIMALQIAVFMGFSQIYLLGFDHDSILNYGGNFENKHFYPEHKAKLVTDKDTFKGSLISYLNLWNQYEAIKVVSEKKGIEIYNATHGGLLDVFERVNFEIITSDCLPHQA